MLPISIGPRIIYFHIPKCAGSTVFKHIRGKVPLGKLDKFLKRKRHTIVHTEYHHARIDAAISEAKKSKFISGHFDTPTLSEIGRKPDDFVFTFLRAPKERLRSAYRYFVSEQGWRWMDLPGSWTDYSYEDFLRIETRSMVALTDNAMVRHLGGDLLETVETESGWREWTDKAISELAEMDFVGFQNNFYEDMNILCRRLSIAPYFGLKANVSENRGEFPISDFAADIERRKTQWDEIIYRKSLELVR
ncbi:sulfotransferase family 2 domain-containing protein [Roseibium sp.]|uniref:sulfotransferase family 2 domain-containing protein n=1 Tax=Roseibium sp. TaxID=1936156 RepID=UPI003BABC4C9